MFNNKVYHKIDALSGSVATLRAEGVKYNEIAEIESRAGTSLAQVIKLDGPNVTLQIFAGARGVDTSARVRFLGETMKIPFGDALLGRAFTGTGKPRDGGPELSDNKVPIGQPSVNPSKRVMPSTRSSCRRSSRSSRAPASRTTSCSPASRCRPPPT